MSQSRGTAYTSRPDETEKKIISLADYSQLIRMAKDIDWDLDTEELLLLERASFEPASTRGYENYLRPMLQGEKGELYGGALLMGYPYYSNEPAYGDFGYQFFFLYDQSRPSPLVACFYAPRRWVGDFPDQVPEEGRFFPCEFLVTYNNTMFRPEVRQFWELLPQEEEYAKNCSLGRLDHCRKLNL